MQIVFHIGANCTDGERLLKSLLKNVDTFRERGVRIPGPGKYRRLLRETIQNIGTGMPAPDTRAILIDAILDDDTADRMVLSQSNFLAAPPRVFDRGVLYANAGMKLGALRRLFPEDSLEIHMAIRNPATFVPAVFAQVGNRGYPGFMNGVDPRAIRWSDLILRMRSEVPEAALTVWCNEDTPLIWSQLIRELAGVDPLTRITGGFDLLSAIMSPEGMKRFLGYLKSHPPQTEAQKRRIIAAFLDKYALDEEIEDEIDLPGWDEALIDELTDAYEEDIHTVAAIEGVTFISP